MKIEKIIHNIRYTLSNTDLKVGDEVYPIAKGRVCDDDTWILHELNYNDLIHEIPHKVINLKYSNYKPYQVQTDKGFGPIECYFKIIKKEQHQAIASKSLHSGRREWVEIKV